MALDRERVFQTAQQFVERQQFGLALAEYGKLLAVEPNDTRTLLRVGDLQALQQDFGSAIETYARVARIYSEQSLGLKAAAVYKQVQELLTRQRPDLLERYSYVLNELLGLYVDLGLINDALQTLDDEASRLRRAKQEHQANQQYRRMTELAGHVPLPHLRLAEGLCRVGQTEEALGSFWRAAELLKQAQRPDDALRVIERMLHFKQEPRFALEAARLYLAKRSTPEGMQALSRLQLCFQADPKDLETLQLLAEAFSIIEQESKALEVQKEIARVAHEQGEVELFHRTLAALQAAAPADDQVVALSQMPPPQPRKSSPASASGSPERPSVPIPLSSRRRERRPPGPPPGSAPSFEPPGSAPSFEALSSPSGAPASDVANALSVPPSSAEPIDILDPSELEFVDEPASSAVPSGPRPVPTSPASLQQALTDARTFRGLRLFDKAIETLQLALESEPRSIELREALRDVHAEVGNREAAIEEMLTMTAIYIEYGRPDHAETVLLNIIEAEPEHPVAQRTLQELRAHQGGPLEAAGPASPTASHPSQPGPSLPPLPTPPAVAPHSGRPSQTGEHVARATSAAAALRPPAMGQQTLDEVLEEAEFFSNRQMFDDAEQVLRLQLVRTPNHPLVLDALRDLQHAREEAAQKPPAPSTSTSTSITNFELQAQLSQLERAVRESQKPAPPGAPYVDVELLFERFKENVRAQVSDNDSATHYDLGLAYKQMNLLDDAIEELKLAAQDPELECNCYATIALIYAEQQMWSKAAAFYTKGLAAAKRTPIQELSLLYDLGQVSELAGQLDKAVHYFGEVVRRDGDFRDAGRRLARLRGVRPSSAAPRSSDDDVDRAFEELLSND